MTSRRSAWRVLPYVVLLLCNAAGQPLRAQGEGESPVPDSLLTAARAIMQEAAYCALITLDGTGQPHARTMDPFSPDEDMVVWLGTHRRSRKVEHIRADPRVTLYYEAPGGTGYVAISGRARIVDVASAKAQRWKAAWDQFYVDPAVDYLLIAVTPEALEIIDYRRGIVGDRETWKVPTVRFTPGTAGP